MPKKHISRDKDTSGKSGRFSIFYNVLNIYKNVPYVEKNFSLAMLIANKVLIEESYDMMIIPVPDMEYIPDLLQEYCIYDTDKAKNVCK